MKMKMKLYMAVVTLMAFSPLMVFGQNALTLDETIEEAANFFSDRISEGVTVSVFNFSSDSITLSEYIIDELTIALINTGIDIIDRNNLNEVNREIYYGFTGAVDDSTAQAYGHDVGVQTVVLGSFTRASDNTYRFRVQAIDVQTKRVQAGRTFSVRQDNQLVTLLNIYEDYTIRERLGYGALNMIFGLGSAMQKDNKWWINTLIEGIGIFEIGIGIGMADMFEEGTNYTLIMGVGIVAVGVVYGFARPFFVHRQNNKTVSLVDPNVWNIELVSTEDNTINGFKLSYRIRL
jgi:hypothetical protein